MNVDAVLPHYIRELEKIARDKEPSTTDKVLKAAPGIGAVAGGVTGAANPRLFDPGWFQKGLKGTSWKGRLASGVMGAGAGATTAWLPSALKDTRDALKPKKKVAEVIQNENGDPAVKILGADIEKLDDRKAHSVPLIEAPPGYVYDPELRAFAPNSEDPGWMTEPEAMQAQENAQAYEQGASDATNAGVAQEAQNAAQASLAGQEQQMSQEAMMQQQAQAQVQQQPGAGQQPGAVPTPPSPSSIVGDHPMAQGGKPQQMPQPKAQRPNSTNSIAR